MWDVVYMLAFYTYFLVTMTHDTLYCVSYFVYHVQQSINTVCAQGNMYMTLYTLTLCDRLKNIVTSL